MSRDFDEEEDSGPPSRTTGWVGAVWLALAGLTMVLLNPPSYLVMRGLGVLAILAALAVALKLMFGRRPGPGVDADGA